MRAASLVPPALVLLALLAPAAAQEGRPGRFTMTPVEGGFLRLDTETGAVSMCRSREGAWSCDPTPDSAEAMKRESERLAAENERLKADIRRMEETFGLGPPKPGEEQRQSEAPPGGPLPGGSGKFELPSEKDVDEAIDYLGRIIKKFRDKIRELDPDRPGTGTPL
jgi:hypothetical protein